MSIKNVLDEASTNTNSLFSQLDWDDEFINEVLAKKTNNGLCTFSEYRLKQWYEDSVLKPLDDIDYSHLVYALNASNAELKSSEYITKEVNKLLNNKNFYAKYMDVDISLLNEHQIDDYLKLNYPDSPAVHWHDCKQICLNLQKHRCFRNSNTTQTTTLNKKDDVMNNLKNINVSYDGSKISQHIFYGNDDISEYNTDGLIALIVMLKGKLKTLKKMKIKSVATDNYKQNIKSDIAYVTNMLDNRKI